MADIVITAASVLPSATAILDVAKVAGVAITAGQVVYLDTATNSYKLADANAAAPANSVAGIALNNAAAGQLIAIVTKDPQLAIGGTVAAGATVIASATPGAMCPDADAASGWTKIILGGGVGSNKINFNPVTAGAVP